MEYFTKAREVISFFLDKNLNDIKKSDLSEEQIFSIYEILAGLNLGKIKIAKHNGCKNINLKQNWDVDKIAKLAISLSFLLYENHVINLSRDHEIFKSYQSFYDKIPSKFENWNEKKFASAKIRVVPGGYARYSSHIGSSCVLMPSFVNMGAFIDCGSMIDTWASVGSCAYVGKNCHISGGAGIGGVLEPIGANPTIIEDNCFIGARSEICEGVIIGEGSVIGMGCFIGSSTKIINRETNEIFYGFVPPYSVVVPGTYTNPAHSDKFGTYCVLIIKTIDEKTRAKVKINDLLRGE